MVTAGALWPLIPKALLIPNPDQLCESNTQREQTNLLLTEAIRHRSRFLASRSHELRTFLNGILGFSELLEGQHFGSLNEKQLGYVKRIDESGKHLLSLINDILDVAKIDAGGVETQLEDIVPGETIEAMVSLVKSQVNKKQVKVVLTVDPSITLIQADPRQLKQILLNLLSNAVKYTPEHGQIEVRTVGLDSKYRVEVSDTGIGIVPEEQEKIFSEFHQAEAVHEKVMGGTGIGLALPAV